MTHRNRPEWLEPEAALAAGVPAEFELARTKDLVVCIGEICAYRGGFTFVVTVVLREPDPVRCAARVAHAVPRASEPLPDTLFKITLSYPDGRLARNWGRDTNIYPAPYPEPLGPVPSPSSGSGSSRRNDMGFWAWPLPGPGPVGFTCEWPAYGVRETRVELVGQLLTDAAARSIQLWPEEWLA